MSADDADTVDEDTPDEAERHATNLELFLDLVFVFAVTQIASLISHHPTGTGTAKGLLIAMLVWWQWSQFTWAGSVVDLQSRGRTRVLVLCCIPITLIMTVSIPEAFHASGVWFGVAYLGVQLMVLGMQGAIAVMDPVTRPSFIRYASVATIAPIAVMVGGFTHDNVRVVIWVLAVVFFIAGGLNGASGEWAINSSHFAERHALFIIISLGEVLVAAGASASSREQLDGLTAVALVVAVAVACMFWWMYFAFIPAVAEHTLHHAHGPQRGVLARDLFTFIHSLLVFGLVLFAVVVKHLIPHPDGHLTVDDRWLLALSVLFFVGGLSAFQYRVMKRTAAERLLCVPAVAALCVAGAWMPGLVVIALVAVLLFVAQVLTMRRFKAGVHAHLVAT
jgi:low temperature requirement protein LtrA